MGFSDDGRKKLAHPFCAPRADMPIDAPLPLPPDAEEALAATIRAERVRFAFTQSVLPVFFSPIGAAVLSLALWDTDPHGPLLAWNAGLVVLAAFRLAVVLAFARAPEPRSVPRWERWFLASVLSVALWWGIGAVLLLDPDSFRQQATVFVFLMLMAGGTGASYAAHPVSVTTCVLALTGPATIHFALQHVLPHRTMAFATAMYLVATLRSVRVLGYFFERTHRLSYELKSEKENAEERARRDFLTSMHNRRAFYELGEAALRDAERAGRPLTAIMVDIDHFKSINDRYGHAGGDAAIRAMAALVQAARRGSDIAGRLGGEEFALLVPQTPLEGALTLAERLREAVGTLTVMHEGAAVQFTASFGVAARRPGETLDQLLGRADAALYASKQAGRNRVTAA